MRMQTYSIAKKIFRSEITINGWLVISINGLFHNQRAKEIVRTMEYVETTTGDRGI